MQLLRIGRKSGWYLSWRDYTDDAFELQVIQENWLRWRLNVIRKSCGAGFLVTTSPEVLMQPAGSAPWMVRVLSFGRGRGWRTGPAEGVGQDLATRGGSREVSSQEREGGLLT